MDRRASPPPGGGADVRVLRERAAAAPAAARGRARRAVRALPGSAAPARLRRRLRAGAALVRAGAPEGAWLRDGARARQRERRCDRSREDLPPRPRARADRVQRRGGRPGLRAHAARQGARRLRRCPDAAAGEVADAGAPRSPPRAPAAQEPADIQGSARAVTLLSANLNKVALL